MDSGHRYRRYLQSHDTNIHHTLRQIRPLLENVLAADDSRSEVMITPKQALDVGCRIVQALCRLVIFISCYCLLRGEASAVVKLTKQKGADNLTCDIRAGLNYIAQQKLSNLNDASPASVWPLIMQLPILLVIIIKLVSSVVVPGSYAQVKEVLLYAMLLLALSPVIRSLAETVSTDTVYAVSALLSALHLLVADYSQSKKHTGLINNESTSNTIPTVNRSGISQHSPLSGGVSVSLNSQILSSVCLASRLESNNAVFCLMCAAALLFVVTADASRIISSQRLLTLLYIFGAICALEALEPPVPVLAVWVCTLVAVGIVLPLLFVNLQGIKHVASGPWDEAVPTIGGGSLLYTFQ